MIRRTKFSIVLFTLMLSSIFFVSRASAVTFQDDVDVRFNFESSVSISVSSDLYINNLDPNTSADSNIIKVTADSNNRTGYTVTATVGNSTHTAPSYNTTALVHVDNEPSFTSLSTSDSLSSLTDPNTWGYTISTDGGTTWANYSGLPLYTATGKQLFATNTNGVNVVKFKISAKAGDSIPSGEYNNVINFALTANAVPLTIGELVYMQDFSSLSSSEYTEVLNSMTTDSQYRLIDSRDNNTYYISKLQDGNVWMTQNLDYNIMTSRPLTSSDSDISATTCTGTTCSTEPYTTAAGYTSDGTTVTWTPSNTTVTSLTAANFPNDSAAYNQPHSYDPGDYYQTGTYFTSDTCDYRTGNCTNFSTTPFSGNGTHGHVGNYYNWTAAVASNDTSQVSSNTMANSVCPKGWRLPANGEYGELNSIYNQNRTGSDLTDGDSGLLATPLYFVRAGGIGGGSLGNPGHSGGYWSSTLASSALAYYLRFNSGDVRPALGDYRYFGLSLRCVVRSE